MVSGELQGRSASATAVGPDFVVVAAPVDDHGTVLDLATAVLAEAGMIRHLQTVPLSRLGDFFAITDLLVDVFWEPDPLSMVAEPIAYFGEFDWDMDSRLNLDLAGAEYRLLLEQLGVEIEHFRVVLRNE